MAAHRGVYPQDIGCGVQDEADECEPAEARRRGDQGDAELPSEVNQALLPGQCSGMPCLFPGLPVRWWQVRRHAPTNFFYNNWRFLGRTNASLGAGGYTTWSNMPHNKLPPDNDFNRNPRAYFTNRRGTWFDDYTKYRPYVAVPANIPLFQSRQRPFQITNRAWNFAHRRLIFRTGSLCRLAPSSRLRERTAWRATV